MNLSYSPSDELRSIKTPEAIRAFIDTGHRYTDRGIDFANVSGFLDNHQNIYDVMLERLLMMLHPQEFPDWGQHFEIPENYKAQRYMIVNRVREHDFLQTLQRAEILYPRGVLREILKPHTTNEQFILSAGAFAVAIEEQGGLLHVPEELKKSWKAARGEFVGRTLVAIRSALIRTSPSRDLDT